MASVGCRLGGVIHPWQSPYSSMDNNPIWFNDPYGDDVKSVIGNAASAVGDFFKDVGEAVKKWTRPILSEMESEES